MVGRPAGSPVASHLVNGMGYAGGAALVPVAQQQPAPAHEEFASPAQPLALQDQSSATAPTALLDISSSNALTTELRRRPLEYGASTAQPLAQRNAALPSRGASPTDGRQAPPGHMSNAYDSYGAAGASGMPVMPDVGGAAASRQSAKSQNAQTLEQPNGRRLVEVMLRKN